MDREGERQGAERKHLRLKLRLRLGLRPRLRLRLRLRLRVRLRLRAKSSRRGTGEKARLGCAGGCSLHASQTPRSCEQSGTERSSNNRLLKQHMLLDTARAVL